MKKQVHILIHSGFSNQKNIHVEGYAIQNYWFLGKNLESGWYNFKNIIKSYTQKPVSGILLEIHAGKGVFKTWTDELGYFSCEEKIEDPDCNNFSVFYDGEPLLTNQKLDVIKAEQPLVVSDLDDTILISHVKNRIKKLYYLLFKKAKDRRQVSEMSFVYQKYAKENQAHFFYLTNSEWNLYPLVDFFLKQEGFPNGSVFMNLHKPHWRKMKLRNHEHKEDYLKKIISFFPTCKLLLVGDSGQKDAWIYTRFAQYYPNNVLGIAIRLVPKGMKKKKMKVLFKPLIEKGIKCELFKDGSNLTGIDWF